MADHLQRCLCGDGRYRSQLLRKLRSDSVPHAPSASADRTLGQLRKLAAEIDAERVRQREVAQALEAARRKAEQEAAFKKQLAQIASDPEQTMIRIDEAIAERNRLAYQRAAEELALLAQACGTPMAAAKADEIRRTYPTRSALSSVLKNAGF